MTPRTHDGADKVLMALRIRKPAKSNGTLTGDLTTNTSMNNATSVDFIDTSNGIAPYTLALIARKPVDIHQAGASEILFNTMDKMFK